MGRWWFPHGWGDLRGGHGEQTLKKGEALRHGRLGEELSCKCRALAPVDKDSDSGGLGEGALRQRSQGTRVLLVPGPHCKASGDWKGRGCQWGFQVPFSFAKMFPFCRMIRCWHPTRSELTNLPHSFRFVQFGSKDLESLQVTYGDGNGNPLQYSCLDIAWTEEPGRRQSMRLQESGMTALTPTPTGSLKHRGLARTLPQPPAEDANSPQHPACAQKSADESSAWCCPSIRLHSVIVTHGHLCFPLCSRAVTELRVGDDQQEWSVGGGGSLHFSPLSLLK